MKRNTPISAIPEGLATIQESEKIFSPRNKEKIDEFNKEMKEFNRDFQIKNRNSEISAAEVILTR